MSTALEDLWSSEENAVIAAMVEAMRRREHVAQQLTSWMRHIPLIGELVHAFWFCLITEGPIETIKPRWGMLTFCFLNDGMKPTLWHTWRSIRDPHEGIWPGGAPRNAAEAAAREQSFRDLHERLGDPNTYTPLLADDEGYINIPMRDD